MKVLITILFITVFAGCSRTDVLNMMAPDDKKAQAIEILEALRKGSGEETFALLSEDQKSDDAKQTLVVLAQGMPDHDFTSMNFIDYRWQKTKGKEYYNFVFEYDFEGYYLLANITLEENEGNVMVAGLHVNEVAVSQSVSSQFDFKDAGILHYGFLTAVIILPVFSIATLVVCIRTKHLKRKWLWCVFILIGFMSFKLNWSTGEFGWQPLSLQLFSGSVFSSGANGPWILGFSVPVGAIAFWYKRNYGKNENNPI